ncbi:MAG: protein DpdG [Candidatus Promineifilaceae bacterium]
MEILNNPVVTPHRVHALLRIVSRMNRPKREDILDMLQPAKLVNNQKTASATLSAAREHNLVLEHNDGGYILHPDLKKVDDIEQFRIAIAHQVTGIINPNDDNYLLNSFTAWYAVQSERVLQMQNKKQAADQYHEDMSNRSETEVRDEGRAFNDTKFNGWLRWAAFLGWGIPFQHNFSLLMPNAQHRLKPLLPRLLPNAQSEPFGVFMERLANVCPELDGGELFEDCWVKSRPNEPRGNKLSLMLSTALRTLHHLGHLTLTELNDAPETWQLFPAHPPSILTVTHIQQGGTS